MTYEQALKASKHNPAGVMKVLERLNWQCSKCKGNGQLWLGGGEDYAQCDECKGAGEIEYKWQPKVGEWYLYNKSIYCAAFIGREHVYHAYQSPTTSQDSPLVCGTLSRLCTPILGWEEIERVLEKAGFYLTIVSSVRLYRNNVVSEHQVYISMKVKEHPISKEPRAIAKSRQQAVMKVVIELGKELK